MFELVYENYIVVIIFWMYAIHRL